MKMTYEDAMAVCVQEMDRLSKLINDTYFKAVSAAWRGDSATYQKHQDAISEYGKAMMDCKEVMNRIEIAYAAI